MSPFLNADGAYGAGQRQMLLVQGTLPNVPCPGPKQKKHSSLYLPLESVKGKWGWSSTADGLRAYGRLTLFMPTLCRWSMPAPPPIFAPFCHDEDAVEEGIEKEREMREREKARDRVRKRERERARDVMVTTRSYRYLPSLVTLGHFVACVRVRWWGLSGFAKTERFFVFRMLYTSRVHSLLCLRELVRGL